MEGSEALASFLSVWVLTGVLALAVQGTASAEVVRMRVEPGHPWRPPFGLDRLGRPLDAVVEVPSGPMPAGEYVVVGYREGKEVSRQGVAFLPKRDEPPHVGRVTLEAWPSEVALWVKADPQARPVELARAAVKPPAFEAEAVALPEAALHPIDLGTILVPADWLLLAGGQKATVEVAALSRSNDMPGARVAAWYESAPEHISFVHSPDLSPVHWSLLHPPELSI